MELTSEQQKAYTELIVFNMQPSLPEIRLVGGGGTGKGVLLENIANSSTWEKESSVLDESLKREVIITATTNDACKVLQSKGISGVRTIFSICGLRPKGNKLIATRKPNYDKAMVFVDEASYINEQTRELIFQQLPNCKIVWVMDNAQLAAVGDEKPFITTLDMPEINLSTIMRSEGELQQFNTYLRDCVLSETNPDIMPWHNGDSIQIVNKTDFQLMMNEAYSQDAWNPNKVRTLAYHRDKTKGYSNYIHQGIFGFNSYFAQGTLLRQSGYSRDLRDGEQITVFNHVVLESQLPSKDIFQYHIINHQFYMLDDPVAYSRLRKNPDNYDVMDHPSDFVNLVHTYSSTVHSAQGCTVDTVFVDMPDIMSAFKTSREMYRRLVYSGISRASKKVIIRNPYE